VREVWRRGHPVQGPPRTIGPHQPGDAGGAHLVPEIAASRIGNLLDIALKDLEGSLLDLCGGPKESGLQRGELLTRSAILKLWKSGEDGSSPAWVPRRFAICSRRSTYTSCRSSCDRNEGSDFGAKRKKISKRLKCGCFRESSNRPEWMIWSIR